MAAPRYEIRVRGRISDSLLLAFPNLKPCVHQTETALSGTLEDQAALFAVLGRIEALGLELVELRRLSDGE